MLLFFWSLRWSSLPHRPHAAQWRAEDWGWLLGAESWTGVLQLWCSSQLEPPYAAPLSCSGCPPTPRPRRWSLVFVLQTPPFPSMQQRSLHSALSPWANSDCSFDSGMYVEGSEVLMVLKYEAWIMDLFLEMHHGLSCFQTETGCRRGALLQAPAPLSKHNLFAHIQSGCDNLLW